MPKRVLLCDDDPPILRAAELKLRRAGFDVISTADGQEGWEAIENKQPDLVVTDCQMPRMDGCTLCLRIQGAPDRRGLPIVMLTAKGFELDHDELHGRYGVSVVLTKPFSPRELLKTVESLIGPAAEKDETETATVELERSVEEARS